MRKKNEHLEHIFLFDDQDQHYLDDDSEWNEDDQDADNIDWYHDWKRGHSPEFKN